MAARKIRGHPDIRPPARVSSVQREMFDRTEDTTVKLRFTRRLSQEELDVLVGFMARVQVLDTSVAFATDLR